MSDYKFQHINQLPDLSILENGLFLCIIHADKIPPHIGVSIDGKYFSLKAKGKDEAIPVSEVLKIIDKRTIKTLFVSLEVSVGIEQIKQVYSRFEKTIVRETSCLSPIKDVLKVQGDIQKLSDLLDYLDSNRLSREVFGVYIYEDFKGIPYYEVEDIDKRLESLTKAKV